MFRRWLSNFYRKNKEKISRFAKLFWILILVGIALISSTNKKSNKSEENNEVTIYKPGKTIISGNDVDKETYEKQENLVKTFVEYCNKQQIQEAYDLLTNECKEKMFTTIEAFKNNYYDVIFNQNRECNLQSWITDGNYNTYKVTFIEDIMATGNYKDVEKFEDYITVVTKNGEQKINVNSYIKTEEINKNTKIEELDINVKSVDIYMNSEKYYLEVNNYSSNTIMLDSLKNFTNIKLLGTDDVEYKIDKLNLSLVDLTILKNSQNKKVELEFIKQYGGSQIKGKEIKFKKAIFNRDEYLKDIDNYDKYKEVSIKL